MEVTTIEYEVKIPIVSEEVIEKKLIDSGFRLEYSIEEKDYYIDFRSCNGIRSDIAFRIREKGEKSVKGEITYKGPRLLEDIKVREEITITVENPRILVKVFQSMGFRVYIVEKKRKVFTRGNVKVSIDNVKQLGKFIEIEMINPRGREQYLATLKELLGVLDLSEKEIITKSYLEMILSGDQQ